MNMIDELKAARESQCFMSAEISKLKGQLADALEETNGYRSENTDLAIELGQMDAKIAKLNRWRAVWANSARMWRIQAGVRAQIIRDYEGELAASRNAEELRQVREHLARVTAERDASEEELAGLRRAVQQWSDQAAALRSRNAEWETRLSAVMPEDFKDWRQNAKGEWPTVAAWVVENLRSRTAELDQKNMVLRGTVEAVVAQREAAEQRIGRLLAALPEMIAMAKARQSTDGEPATEFVRRLESLARAEAGTPAKTDQVEQWCAEVEASLTPAKHPDTVRLDWLEQTEARRCLTYNDLRAAIDAAMQGGAK